MTELANIFNEVGVGIGLLIFILFGVITIIGYLVSTNKTIATNTATELKTKDCERLEERKQYELRLEEILKRQADSNLQVAKSNQNIADALKCIQSLVDTMNKKFETHDERAIAGFKDLCETTNEIKVRVESCNRKK